MVKLAAQPKATTNLPSNELVSLARKLFTQLEHLQNLKDPNSQKKIVSALRKAMEELQQPQKDKTAELRSDFLNRYNVKIANNSVSFTLPKGSSVVDLLRDAQAISFLLRGVVAVYPPRLNAWRKAPNFNKPMSRDLAIEVTPLLKNSEFKSRKEQGQLLKQLGLRMAEDWELAAAHAIFSVYKNKPLADLFAGHIVRVKGTKLYYGNGGLSEMDESDYVNNCSYKNVKVASARRR